MRQGDFRIRSLPDALFVSGIKFVADRVVFNVVYKGCVYCACKQLCFLAGFCKFFHKTGEGTLVFVIEP